MEINISKVLCERGFFFLTFFHVFSGYVDICWYRRGGNLQNIFSKIRFDDALLIWYIESIHRSDKKKTYWEIIYWALKNMEKATENLSIKNLRINQKVTHRYKYFLHLVLRCSSLLIQAICYFILWIKLAFKLDYITSFVYWVHDKVDQN